MSPAAFETESGKLSDGRPPLSVFVSPASVAVIGATPREGTVGYTVYRNLTQGSYKGTVYAVNPNRRDMFGAMSYPTVSAIPATVDLAVIATPASTVPATIADCIAAGVKGAIVLSAGFKEAGEAGRERERQVFELARRGNLRIVGPNCVGVMSPLTGLNATFASAIARPGNVAFLSQSGAFCTAVLDWSLREKVGFSAMFSVGSMVDVGWADLIDYFGQDPRTSSIVIYMESMDDPRGFLSAAQDVARKKPIVVIKAGRSEAAARATLSHTGALAGSDDVMDAVFRRAGVFRVHNISDIFYMAELLSKQPLPKGPRLTILTNAGGPGVLATDSLMANGGEIAELAPQTMAALNALLPDHWSHNNPVDILGDADADRYSRAVEICAKDPNSDGLLVVLAPQGMIDPADVASQLRPYAKLGKPIIASWMGGVKTGPGEQILNDSGIPTFPYADTAARAFCYMWQYSRNIQEIYETPSLPAETPEQTSKRERARKIIDSARSAGRTILTEAESKQLLAAYGIPVVDTRVARTEAQAVRIADDMGFPVVLKLHSDTITHKSDVGGVSLNLFDADAVRAAYNAIHTSVAEKAGPQHFGGVSVQPMIRHSGYELIIGSITDPQFGPVLMFGSGGQLVEVYRDRALALPPLNTTLARRMMEQTRVFAALRGVRGRKAVDLSTLDQLLVRFSQLIVDQRWIREMDVNPLIASAGEMLALDARVVLHDPATPEEQLPRTVIRPYPDQYVTIWHMPETGLNVIIRPIRPEDEPMMVDFHGGLSDHTVYMRYFTAMKLSQRTTHERLTRVCCIDYDREMALVAEVRDPETQKKRIIGVARLVRLRNSPQDAEFAVLVSDAWHRRGVGAELARQLIEVARGENVRHLQGAIMPDNVSMQRLAESLGFSVEYSDEEKLVMADLDL
jgi:acetyltransferase